MSATSQLTGSLQGIFERADCGVVPLVDELLRFCAEQNVQLDWTSDRCRLRSLADGSEEEFEPPLPRSVFRAVLARVATLCNQRTPGTVSPYGGQGELPSGVESPALLRVTFANTSDEQTLDVVPLAESPVVYQDRAR
jgi:hypothetical protein